MQTRRKFLRDCSLVAVTASLAPAAAMAQNPAPRTTGLTGPGFEQFARQVNTPFFVQAGSQIVKLLLVEASPFSAASPNAADAGFEKFLLRFRGPAVQPLEQDTYRFTHSRLDHVSIFIVPTGCLDETHCHYEAIFDRPAGRMELAVQISQAPRRVQEF
jgi:hypothetical protein